MNAIIATPANVRTFTARLSGPMVSATDRKSSENGPTDGDTEAVRNERAALSGRNDSAK